MVVTRDGETVLTLSDFVARGWLDDSRIVGYDGSQVVIASLIDSSITPVDIPRGDYLLPSGHGAVAIATFLGELAPDIPDYDFVVWSQDGVSEPHPGFPFMWSRSEKEPTIAVYHPMGPTRGVDGWLEVVSSPDLETVYEDLPHQQIGNASFDPHGDFIAFRRDDPDRHTRIATTYGGDPFDLPPDDRGMWFWTPATLNMIDNAGVERSWGGTGNLISIRTAPAAFAKASADGSTVVYWNEDEDGDGPSLVTVSRDGVMTEVVLPPQSSGSDCVVSSDGLALAIARGRDVFLRAL